MELVTAINDKSQPPGRQYSLLNFVGSRKFVTKALCLVGLVLTGFFGLYGGGCD